MRHEPLGTDRILVACHGSSSDALLGIKPVMDWSGFEDRDLVFLMQENDAIYTLTKTGLPTRLRSISVAQIKSDAECSAGKVYTLIGKDGGVKRRWTDTLSIDDLFHNIDAMPMRQFEMRTRGKN